MNAKYLLQGLFLTTFFMVAIAVQAQQPSLYIEAKTTPNGIEVIWIPTSTGTWETNIENGYILTRTEVASDGTATGVPVELLNGTSVRDSLWFAQLTEEDNPLLEPIGGLLYDTLFQFPPNDQLDEMDMKYNYIMEEASNYFEIAAAMGVGFKDESVEEGKTYRYTVITQNRTDEQSVNIENVYFNYVNAPEGYVPEFEHPNDLSLSQMYADANPNPRSFIKAIGKSYGDSIVIRWGPNNAALWETAKENGFTIFRSLDGSSYESIATVKPWGEEEVTEAAIGQDTMAMLAAGLLYGIDEHLTNDNSLYEQNSIFENNLGFALFAAERSPLAADVLGFRFVDRNIEKDSTYIYLIGTEGIVDLWDAGKVTVYPGSQTLEAPKELTSESLESSIKLTWAINENRDRFSSYTVEKSVDGVNYQNITPVPLVFMETNETTLLQYTFVDSVENYQKTYYRLYGFDSFGDKSPAAEVTGIATDKTPPLSVDIFYADFNREEDNVRLEWTLPEEQHPDISHYQVLLSEEKEGLYSAISEPLAITTNNYFFSTKGMDTGRAFYFRVDSYDENGNVASSLPVLVPIPDLIAPEPPALIAAKIDSNSVVTVAWEHSSSTDVVGYWLYWANDPDDEMTPLNEEVLTDNSYTYTLDTETLTDKIYYCVRAQDRSYNKGRITEIVELQRLDYNPPIPPYDFYGNNGSTDLSLNWKKSPSEDVAYQLIYRSLDEVNWERIDSLGASIQSYADFDSLQIGQAYSYFLQAVDESGNVSERSKILKMDYPFYEYMASAENLAIKINDENAQLNWEILINQSLQSYPYTIEIQKSTGAGPLRYHRTLSADESGFTDTDIQPNVLYNYAIRVRFDNGWVGDLSEVKSVMTQ